MTTRRWVEYVVAILAGNAIYFAVLFATLPPELRHEPLRIDAGLVLDFLCCVLVYAAIRLGGRRARRLSTGRDARSPTVSRRCPP
ncbi:MAG: hypothetical protein ABI968_12605 [Acidobacteriota bacterium]